MFDENGDATEDEEETFDDAEKSKHRVLPIDGIAHERAKKTFQNRNESRTKPHVLLLQIEHFVHDHQ